MTTTFHNKADARAATAAAPSANPRTARRVAALAAAMSLAATLAGCGSGGGGGGDTAAAPPAATPASGASTSAYLIAGVVGSEATGHNIVVADTDVSQAAALLTVPVLASLSMVSTAAYTIDAASPSVTFRGTPLTFFVNEGRLWQIDLSPGRVPASVRVSSMTDGCQPLMVAPLDASGTDAWVLVQTAGADGDCVTASDNRQAFVRSGTPSTTAPTMVPPEIDVEPVYLTGPDGALWWMLAVDSAGATPRMVAYGPSLNVVDVAGGSGIHILNVQGHAAKAADGIYVRADNTLRRVEASPTALRIGASQLGFTGASSLVLLEGTAMYFSDADGVYKVEGDALATLLARPSPGAASTALQAMTAATLVLTQPSAGGGNTVWTVDKQSGAAQELLRQDDNKNDIWALHGEQLFYFAASRGAVGELRSIRVDGSGDSGAFSNLLLVGRVVSPVWNKGERNDISGTKSLLACQPLPGNSDCRGSTLVQIDLPSLAVTALGRFPASSAAEWGARGGAAYVGLKGAVVEVHSKTAADSATHVDLYVFNPGEANSLKQVSPTTP